MQFKRYDLSKHKHEKYIRMLVNLLCVCSKLEGQDYEYPRFWGDCITVDGETVDSLERWGTEQ